ncbi:serine/arginine repetitive matrix protein 1-like [Podarcis raffonei]|uniref:serine/arginine repetitive matrix protein 1-like n=1 Tax=Podarcis raffonei TaxID=65483 RepID=UPI00232993B0|nr:serine/arginine repetitive matrix protein 1-like [Podarcis raffonei]
MDLRLRKRPRNSAKSAERPGEGVRAPITPAPVAQFHDAPRSHRQRGPDRSLAQEIRSPTNSLAGNVQIGRSFCCSGGTARERDSPCSPASAWPEFLYRESGAARGDGASQQERRAGESLPERAAPARPRSPGPPPRLAGVVAASASGAPPAERRRRPPPPPHLLPRQPASQPRALAGEPRPSPSRNRLDLPSAGRADNSAQGPPSSGSPAQREAPLKNPAAGRQVSWRPERGSLPNTATSNCVLPAPRASQRQLPGRSSRLCLRRSSSPRRGASQKLDDDASRKQPASATAGTRSRPKRYRRGFPNLLLHRSRLKSTKRGGHSFPAPQAYHLQSAHKFVSRHRTPHSLQKSGLHLLDPSSLLSRPVLSQLCGSASLASKRQPRKPSASRASPHPFLSPPPRTPCQSLFPPPHIPLGLGGSPLRLRTQFLRLRQLREISGRLPLPKHPTAAPPSLAPAEEPRKTPARPSPNTSSRSPFHLCPPRRDRPYQARFVPPRKSFSLRPLPPPARPRRLLGCPARQRLRAQPKSLAREKEEGGKEKPGGVSPTALHGKPPRAPFPSPARKPGSWPVPAAQPAASTAAGAAAAAAAASAEPALPAPASLRRAATRLPE